MKQQIVTILLAALGPLPLAARAQSTEDNLVPLVKHLGLAGTVPASDFNKLAQKPEQALPLLVKELHPIKQGTYFEKQKTDDSNHVLYCLRALRYLTGQTFSATTKEKLSSDESQFVDFDKEMHDKNPGHKLHFFAVWMSRNADIVAPRDAQLKIIEQWKTFAGQPAGKIKFAVSTPAEKSMEAWYWFG